MLQVLQSDPRVDVTAYGNFPLRVACVRGHVDAVKLLLQHPGADPAARDGQALLLAASYGHVEVVNLLLADPRTKLIAADDVGRAADFAARGGHAAIVRALLAYCDDEHLCSDALENAAGGGHADVVDALLSDGRDCTAPSLTMALTQAAGSGHMATLRRLMAHPGIADAAPLLDAMSYAALAGQAAAVRLLLADARVVAEPALADDCLSCAAEGGHLELLELLLADPRARSSECVTSAMSSACKHDLSAVAQLLLSLADGEHLAAMIARGLRAAAEADSVDSVDLLLAHPRTSAALINGSSALVEAARQGRLDMVKRLLRDARVDPAAGNCAAVRAAASSGRAAVVNLLLADPRVAVAGGSRRVFSELHRVCTGSSFSVHSMTREPARLQRLERLRFRRDESDDEKQDVADGNADGCHAAAEEMLGESTRQLVASAASTSKDLQRAALVAAGSGRVDLLEALLADSRLDLHPHDDTGFFEALSAGVGEGHAGVMDLLLRAEPCWVPGECSYSLWQASRRGRTACVELLLADGRADPTYKDYRNFNDATAKGQANVLRLLLGDPRVDRATAGRRIFAALLEARQAKAKDDTAPVKPRAAVLSEPALLHACMAGAPSAGFPSFMRSAVRDNLPSIMAKAWARRRLVVAARQRALEEE